jgi:transposase-like protein
MEIYPRKLEAVKLIKEHGVGYVRTARDLGVHQSVPRNWVKGFEANLQHSSPAQGQMKLEQLEIARRNGSRSAAASPS